MRLHSIDKIAVVALIVGGLYWSAHAPPSVSKAAAPATNIAHEIQMTPDMAETIAALIKLEGYNCPAAKLSYAKGPGPLGDDTQVYCGPADRDGVFEKLVYRVTFRPNNEGWVVKPW